MEQLPAIHWSAQSVALTLANKAVFSSQVFDYPWTVLACQSAIVVFTLTGVTLLRPLHRPWLSSTRLLQDMLLSGFLFALYQYSFARALRFISLPSYTVVKSLAPLAVTLAEGVIFRDRIPLGVFGAIILALCANFLTFDLGPEAARELPVSAVQPRSIHGYSWAVFHVVTHVLYVLSLRWSSQVYLATDKAFLANLIALLVFLPMAVVDGEYSTFLHQTSAQPNRMLAAIACSFGLSAGCALSVMTAFDVASSITLRYLALANKLAIVLIGACIFPSELSVTAWLGVALSIVSGYLYVYSKSKAHASSSFLRPMVSSPSLEMLWPSDDADDSPTTNPRFPSGNLNYAKT